MTSDKPVSLLDQLKYEIVAALNAVGIGADDVFVTANGIALPFADMQISLKSVKGQRVWQCTERYSTLALDSDVEKTKTVIRFEEPMEHPLRMARSVAIYIATTRIDAALDAAS